LVVEAIDLFLAENDSKHQGRRPKRTHAASA
jgi:hypothetical protein